MNCVTSSVIAGDEIVGAGRQIFVPEAWQRAEQERDNRLRIVRFRRESRFHCRIGRGRSRRDRLDRGRCDARAANGSRRFRSPLRLSRLANTWPMHEMRLTTAEPVTSVGR